MREIKFSFMWQHQDTGTWVDKRYTLDEIIVGKSYGDFALLIRYHQVARRQYTGLKDKNGVEIYEGDIIRTSTGRSGLVKYDKDFCGFSAVLVYKDGHKTEAIITHPTMNPCEVIGNMYENPELLEG